MPTVLVVYYSRTGDTKRLVGRFVEEVKRVEGADVVVRDAYEAKVEDLLNADAIVFASPSYFRLPVW